METIISICVPDNPASADDASPPTVLAAALVNVAALVAARVVALLFGAAPKQCAIRLCRSAPLQLGDGRGVLSADIDVVLMVVLAACGNLPCTDWFRVIVAVMLALAAAVVPRTATVVFAVVVRADVATVVQAVSSQDTLHLARIPRAYWLFLQ